jgi:peptidoglycan/xylan/chitin deacetylase (PgdA/CDA1 family)
MTKYIFRFDDFSRYSDQFKWTNILEHFESKKIPALISVIPDCKDEKLAKREPINDNSFWFKLSHFKKFDLGMHGLHHENFGLMGFDQQLLWMKDSMKMFAGHRIIPDVFVPPNHSYNKFTFLAMKNVGLSILSDGRGLYPWKDDATDITIVPQILWTPRKIDFGVITFSMHLDTMNDKELENILTFASDNKNDIISILDAGPSPLSLINIPFEWFYNIIYDSRKDLKMRTG